MCKSLNSNLHRKNSKEIFLNSSILVKIFYFLLAFCNNVAERLCNYCVNVCYQLLQCSVTIYGPSTLTLSPSLSLLLYILCVQPRVQKSTWDDGILPISRRHKNDVLDNITEGNTGYSGEKKEGWGYLMPQEFCVQLREFMNSKNTVSFLVIFLLL